MFNFLHKNNRKVLNDRECNIVTSTILCFDKDEQK